MVNAVRNLGRSGLAASAISAIDAALWDLKAKLLDLPLVGLLGRAREEVPIYGSGGFTSYDDGRLTQQLARWVEEDGCKAVKMKIGSNPEDDPHRVRVAKRAAGDAALFVDANGALAVKEALRLANIFAAEADVAWFEEPVSSDDLEGLAKVRAAAPAGMDVAAGEYVFNTDDARHMLAHQAVDVQQADVSRCLGVTGFLEIGVLCSSHHIDLSGHCAPALHLHAACAVPRLRHLEWFHDHVRIEQMLFDGAPHAKNGSIRPDLSRPGFGLDFKLHDAEPYAA
jgi:L-alanine-DL-glutamate epimerase-like enolase superfamily enzyme